MKMCDEANNDGEADTKVIAEVEADAFSNDDNNLCLVSYSSNHDGISHHRPLDITSLHRLASTNSALSLTSSLTTSEACPSYILNMNPRVDFSHPRVDLSQPSIIHDEARITHWRKVQSLASTHPQYASYKSDDGLTALHHACSRRCPEPSVFQALIDAHPHALIEKDHVKGWTPLHHSCRFKCPKECVRLLLHSYPEYGRYACQVRDKDTGRTPLYYAMRYDAPDGVVQMLLGCMERNDILDCDREGHSVLGLVWDKWATSFEGKRFMAYYNDVFKRWVIMQKNTSDEIWWKTILDDSEDQREKLTGKLKHNWTKTNMLLRGAFRFDLLDQDKDGDANELLGRKFRILHATSAIKCHESLFLMSCILHPEQAREPDRDDLFMPSLGVKVSLNTDRNACQSVLHIAAKSPSNGESALKTMEILLLLNEKAAFSVNPADQSLPLHYLCENQSKQHWLHDGIHMIYSKNPEACISRDVLGRTPLHRAATVLESSLFLPTVIPSNSVSLVTSSNNSSTRTHISSSSSRLSISSVSDLEGSIIQNILISYPAVASFRDVFGKTPLHSIAEYAEEWDANVQAVYDAFPEAKAIRDNTILKSLPIHLLSSNMDAKTTLIEKFVGIMPKSLTFINGLGKLPLHLACEAGRNWKSGFKLMYDAFPNAINLKDDINAWMPLHFIVSSQHSTKEMVEHVLELAPDGAFAVDRHRRTPFHLAIESGKSWETGGLGLLFQANPDAIDAKDSEGRIPIVSALLKFSEFDKNESDQLVIDTTGSDVSSKNNTVHNSFESEIVSEVLHINLLFELLRKAPQVLSGDLD